MKEKVNKLCEIKKQMDALKIEKETLEAELLIYGETNLKDTKNKTLILRGDRANCVTITIANSVKLIYPTMLKQIFGKCYNDVIKEETKYTLSDPAKRLLSGLYLGNYLKETKLDVFSQFASGDTLNLIMKKVKGTNFEKDKENLKTICGMADTEAEYYAYFIQEAVVWENFQKLKLASDADVSESDSLEFINTAITTEETIKLTISS